jgi:Asp-tRNA(Asn)/Glu-tRNA(Gln) amidotransferase C subunit
VNTNQKVNEHVIKASELREDVVKSASEEEKALIMKNFPQQQGTYLVVPKVIQ